MLTNPDTNSTQNRNTRKALALARLPQILAQQAVREYVFSAQHQLANENGDGSFTLAAE